MVETPRFQAKHFLSCRRATCHSGQRAGIQEIELLSFWMPDQVQHDKRVDFSQPDLELLVLDEGCSIFPAKKSIGQFLCSPVFSFFRLAYSLNEQIHGFVILVQHIPFFTFE